MLRLSLVLAFLAAVGSLCVSLLVTKPKLEELNTNLATTTENLTKTQGELATSKKDATAAKALAEKVSRDLNETKGQLETAVADLTTQRGRADKLQGELSKANKARNDAEAELAQWQALQVKPDQVVQIRQDLKTRTDERDALAGEKKIFQREIAQLANKLERYEGKDADVKLPAGLKGQVAAVDGKWGFVQLNIGSDNGVLPRGKMMVVRNGKLLTKVQITSVEKDRSFANVLPEWTQGDLAVAAGDTVLY